MSETGKEPIMVPDNREPPPNNEAELEDIAMERVREYLASIDLVGDEEPLLGETLRTESNMTRKLSKKWRKKIQRRRSKVTWPETCKVMMMYAQQGSTESTHAIPSRKTLLPNLKEHYEYARLGNTEDQDTRSPKALKTSPRN
ncbi:MAG TPA: hypothetical protein VK861_06250 [Bacteroidales bacterium]|nr:hypothetical protein [Bacteroidales bacterium]